MIKLNIFTFIIKSFIFLSSSKPFLFYPFIIYRFYIVSSNRIFFLYTPYIYLNDRQPFENAYKNRIVALFYCI